MAKHKESSNMKQATKYINIYFYYVNLFAILSGEKKVSVFAHTLSMCSSINKKMKRKKHNKRVHQNHRKNMLRIGPSGMTTYRKRRVQFRRRRRQQQRKSEVAYRKPRFILTNSAATTSQRKINKRNASTVKHLFVYIILCYFLACCCLLLLVAVVRD